MRLSTRVRRRHQGRPYSGAARNPVKLRLAAGLVGLAMVGSLGVGSMVSAQAEEPAAGAGVAASADGTPAATEPSAAADAAADSGAPAAGGEEAAEDAAPAEIPAAAGDAAPVEGAGMQPAEPEADTPAAGEGAASDPAADAAQQAPAAPQLKPAPAVQALAAPSRQLTCGSGIVYTIDGSRAIRQVNTANGNESSVGTIDSDTKLNGLALTKGATSAYAVRSEAAAESWGPWYGPWWDQKRDRIPSYMTVYRYDSVSGNTRSYKVQEGISTGGTFVMGGINPANGIYYYGRVVSSKLELYAFNTNNNSDIGFVGSVAIPNDSNGTSRSNGDLVFSSDGTMYFVASSGGTAKNANALMQVTGQLPTTAGTATLGATLVTNLDVKNEAFNGIAFEGGYLYLDTSNGNFYKVDASGGTIVQDFGKKLSSPVDMASCQYNNSLKVQKNIVSRVGAGDQFTMTATVGNKEIGSPGTTVGSSVGLQDGPDTFASSVPTSGTEITIKEVGTSGTNLSQYTSSWVCKNGAGTSVASGSGTGGTFTFPAQTGAGVNVTCVFTNQPRMAQVKVTKTWVNAVDGDLASFTANDMAGTSSAPAKSDVISASFAQGTTVNVQETLGSTNKGVYTTTLKCTTAAGATVAQGTLAGSFVLGTSDVTCAYTNTNAAATVVVEKNWIVDGKPYNNGGQPAGMSAALTLTRPGTAGATAQEWDTVRTGYAAGNTVTIAEATAFEPGLTCELTKAEVTLANGTTTTAPVPYAAVLAPGANKYTVTNTVECTTVLTLLKFIDDSNGGTLVPGDFNLTAKPSSGPAITVAGANTVSGANTKAVTAGVNHTLSESSDDKPAYLQLALQRYTGTFNTDGSLADSDAWEDAAATNVSVATGHHEVYRFVNASVPTMTLPLTGGTGSLAYLLVGGGFLLLALLVTAWILARRGKANRA